MMNEIYEKLIKQYKNINIKLNNKEKIYQSIKYYLEKEPNYFIKQHKKDLLIKWMVILMLLLIVIIVKVVIGW